MGETEKESNLEVSREKKTNKKLIVFTILGIIFFVIAVSGGLFWQYLIFDDTLPANLTEYGPDKNGTYITLPAPNVTDNIITTPAMNTSLNRSKPSGGGGGGGTDTPDTCTPSRDCSYYYNLNQCGSFLNDGCTDSLNCQSCNSGFYCNGTRCLAMPSCTTDANCTLLNGYCKTGLCNLTISSCYANFFAEESICAGVPGGMCHNGKCVKCINGNHCGVNETCIEGYCFNENEAFSFMFMGDDISGGVNAYRFANASHSDLEIIFWIPDLGGTSGRYNSIVNEWNKTHPDSPTPLFMGLGNHDAEVMANVNYSVEVLGPKLSKSLPGMKNFREGPYDIYPNGYEDRNLTYSFDYKNAHFIMMYPFYHDLLLNISYIGGICGAGTTANRFESGYGPTGCMSDDMLVWLENDLKNTNATFKFMFYHEGAHPLPGGRHTGDSLDCIYCTGNWVDRSWMNRTRPPMTEKFWSLLAKYNVTANFVGHAHHNTLTWANDLSGGNGAVYEVESGNPPRLSVVNIRGENATLRLYNLYPSPLDTQFEPFGPFVLNKDSINHFPKLYQHDGGNEAGFPVVEKRNIDLEVGQSLSTGSTLWFEAKDMDREDNLTFSFDNLPNFLAVNDPTIQYSAGAEWIKLYRRILLTTNISSSNNDLGIEQIGNYSFDIIVSDGQLEDKINMNLSVLPKGNPEVLGASIKNGTIINFPMYRAYVSFVCQDNEAGPAAGGIRGSTKLVFNGVELLWNGTPYYPSSLGWSGTGYKTTDKLAINRFEFIDDYDGIEEVMPGKYELTYYCWDILGHYSNNFSLTFFVVNDSVMPPNQIFGSWPAEDSNVNEISRITFFAVDSFSNLALASLVNLTEVRKDGSLFNDYYLVSWRYNGSLSWGNPYYGGSFDIIFKSPAENGIYSVDINGSIFNFNVGSGGIGGNSAQAEVHSLNIWSWIKGFLTGNTIKEITGYFLNIKD